MQEEVGVAVEQKEEKEEKEDKEDKERVVVPPLEEEDEEEGVVVEVPVGPVDVRDAESRQRHLLPNGY